MKSVLRSIKPYWLYLIIVGKKTIEVGKNFPKADDWNKIVYLYCSQDIASFKRIPAKDCGWMKKYLGKVACRFFCDKNYDITPHYDIPSFANQYICGWEYDKEFDCLTHDELLAYLKGQKGYGWHVTDKCAIFLELKHFSKVGFGHLVPLKRPPQSWMYVELISDIGGSRG